MEILIIRHCEPDYEVDSLTEKGWRESELLSERLAKLDIAEFYTSPLGRAKDSAIATLKKMNRKAETLEWLREFNGNVKYDFLPEPIRCWDMLPSYWTQVDEYYSRDAWYKTELMRSGNVEEEYKWVASELDKFLAARGYIHDGRIFRVEKESHDRIAFFCHFGSSCIILAHLLGVSPVILLQGFVMQTSSVTSIVTEEREKGIASFRIRSYGDISHLYEAEEEPSFTARFCECFSDETRHEF